MKINKEAINMIKNSNNVAIFVHIKPDGDCLGCASALKEALLQLGKKVDIYCDDEVPSNFMFLAHINDVNKPLISENDYDLAIAVDASDLKRIGKYAELFKSIKNSIKFDHHKTIENFATINIVEPTSSACLILYYYILQFAKINKEIACALYAGISSDTGCYVHTNTTSEDHYVSAKLIDYGFDLNQANYYLFKLRTKPQIMLAQVAFNSLQFLQDGKLAILSITEKDFKETNTSQKDTFFLPDIVINIEGVKVGVAISEEKNGLFRCSFRSVGDYDVSLLAQIFGGGGHKNASGCNIFGHLPTVIKKIETEFIKLYKE